MQLVKSNVQRVTLTESYPVSVFENQTLVFSKPHIQEITPDILIKGWSRFSYISVATNVLLFGVLSYSFFFRPLSSELSQSETMTTPKEVLPISESLKNGDEIVDNALRLLLTEPSVDPDSLVRIKLPLNEADGIIAKSKVDKTDPKISSPDLTSVSETIKQINRLDQKSVSKPVLKLKKAKKNQKPTV